MTFGFSVVRETAPGSTAACPTGSCHTEMAVTKCAAGKVRPKVRRMDLEAQKGPKMRPKVQNVDLEAQEGTGPSARTGEDRPECPHGREPARAHAIHPNRAFSAFLLSLRYE